MSDRREWWINPTTGRLYDTDPGVNYGVHVREVLPDVDKHAEPYIQMCEHEILKVQHAKLVEAARPAMLVMGELHNAAASKDNELISDIWDVVLELRDANARLRAALETER